MSSCGRSPTSTGSDGRTRAGTDTSPGSAIPGQRCSATRCEGRELGALARRHSLSRVRASTSGPAVELSGLVKRFGRTTAVEGLGLRLDRGQVLALLGPNGAGKTTTIEICEGFLRRDGGSVRVLGLDPATQHERLRPRIGVMPQGGGAYPGVRAEEMLALVAACAANPIDPAWLIDVLGLSSARRTPYKRLSGGQQQRLSLACALVGRPELVFLDEPTAGLDPQARRLVWELVRALRTDGVSVLLTTHAMEEAEELADHVVIIDHGRVVAEGSPSAAHGGAAGGGAAAVPRAAGPGHEPAVHRAAGRLPHRRADAGHVPADRARRPAGGLGGHGVVRAAGCPRRGAARRSPQPRGRLPRTDGTGAAVTHDVPGRHLHAGARPRSGRADAVRARAHRGDADAAQRRADPAHAADPGRAAGRAHGARHLRHRGAARRLGGAARVRARGDVVRVHRAGHRARLRPPLRRAETPRRDVAPPLAARHRTRRSPGSWWSRCSWSCSACSRRCSAGRRTWRGSSGRCCW